MTETTGGNIISLNKLAELSRRLRGILIDMRYENNIKYGMKRKMAKIISVSAYDQIILVDGEGFYINYGNRAPYKTRILKLTEDSVETIKKFIGGK